MQTRMLHFLYRRSDDKFFVREADKGKIVLGGFKQAKIIVGYNTAERLIQRLGLKGYSILAFPIVLYTVEAQNKSEDGSDLSH